MPWCPHCDEVFPEGPQCPRCRSDLIDDQEGTRVPQFPSAGQLPQLKVPRRLRRAFGGRSGSRTYDGTPPRSLLALALACLLFASGFLIGRMGSLVPDSPVIVGLSAQPLGLPTDGAVSYVLRLPGNGDDPALVRHDLGTGDIDRLARFTLPFGAGATTRARPELATSSASTAVVIPGRDGSAYVGAFGGDRAFPLWLEGTAAAFETPSTLFVLDGAGDLARWTIDGVPSGQPIEGTWAQLLPASGGAVLVRVDADARRLVAATPKGLRDTIAIGDEATVLAASSDGAVALVDVDGEARLWDGETYTPLRADRHQAVGASFSPDSRRVAVTLIERGRRNASTPVWLGVADRSGRVAFDKVTTWADGEGCRATPAWGSTGRWVYLAPGDGSVYAIEAGGAPPRGVATRILGCGLGFAG